MALSAIPQSARSHFGSEHEWKIYPNPATERFSVEFEGAAGDPVEISIHDLNGNTILTKKVIATGSLQTEQFELSPKSYPSGIYLVKAVSESREKVFKIIKQQ
jgi:hypothetical protein